MMIDKPEEEIIQIINEWARVYFSNEIYGFGLSDEIGLPTFFEKDMISSKMADACMGNLHNLGIKADTHRVGVYAGQGFKLKAVFDNNSAIHNTVIRGHKVISPSEIPKVGKIKIAVFSRRYQEIKKQLEGFGLSEYIDFIYYNTFVALYNYYIQKKVLLRRITVAITTKCNLKCEHCNMFMPQYKKPTDMPFDTLSSDLDVLFGRVDYIQMFAIIGGEPLLYKNLVKYLHKLKEYVGRIGEVIIATNGSLIPCDEVLGIAKELNNVRFMINNYELGDKYSEKFKASIDKIKKNGLSYTLRNYDWNSYVREFPIESEDELKSHYIRCGYPFTAFQDKHFYPCHLTWSAANCGLWEYNPEDSIDFTNPHTVDFDIVRAGLGYTKYGYLSFCRVCNGCDPAYLEKVTKAAQII